jgi:hypothetical protein
MMELKKILALGAILLFIGVAVAPNINFNVVKASNDNDIVEVTTQKQSDVSGHLRLGFPSQGLYYYVSPFINNLTNGIFYPDYKLLRNWIVKPFPNVTAMFIGSVGFLSFYNVTIVLEAHDPIYSKVDVFSDGEYYNTLYPKFYGPISSRHYYLFYYEKGFHSLKFITEDNTSLTLDVQIGWNGFINNIFPYLIKTG